MKKFSSRSEYSSLQDDELREILKHKRKVQKFISNMFVVIGIISLLYTGMLGWTMFFAFEMSVGGILNLFNILHVLLALSFILTAGFNSIQRWEGFFLNIAFCLMCGFDNSFFFVIIVPIVIIMILAKNLHLDLLTLMAMENYPFMQKKDENAEMGLAYVDRKAFMGIKKEDKTDEQVMYYDTNNLIKFETEDVPMDEVDLNAYNHENFSVNSDSADYMQSTDDEYRQNDFSGGSGLSDDMQSIEDNYKDF